MVSGAEHRLGQSLRRTLGGTAQCRRARAGSTDSAKESEATVALLQLELKCVLVPGAEERGEPGQLRLVPDERDRALRASRGEHRPPPQAVESASQRPGSSSGSGEPATSRSSLRGLPGTQIRRSRGRRRQRHQPAEATCRVAEAGDAVRGQRPDRRRSAARGSALPREGVAHELDGSAVVSGGHGRASSGGDGALDVLREELERRPGLRLLLAVEVDALRRGTRAPRPRPGTPPPAAHFVESSRIREPSG